MWVRVDDEHACAPAFFCGEDCQRQVIETDPDKDWQVWGLGRFLASSIAISDVGEQIVELFEQVALKKFNGAAGRPGDSQEEM
jgi:hypothetical protein